MTYPAHRKVGSTSPARTADERLAAASCNCDDAKMGADGETLGEADLPEIRPEPLRVVVDALRAHSDAAELWEHLPDLDTTTE